MPNINAHQISLIHYSHARGFSTHRIAALSGVTLAATERYLLKHRLDTGCRATCRETLAVKILSHLALARSVPLGLRTCRNNSNGYDHTLIVGGKTVYTTVAHQQSDGSYRFNLNGARFVSANSRLLTKRCRVVVLVGLPKAGGNPDVYMLDISSATAKMTINPDKSHLTLRNNWGIFRTPVKRKIKDSPIDFIGTSGMAGPTRPQRSCGWQEPISSACY